MLIFKKVTDIQKFVKQSRKNGKTIGFAPTMGALHEGHMSLVSISKWQSDLTVCSIFVNPTQFNDKEDLKNYPRPIERDIELLVKNGCDVLFLPEVSEVYPDILQKLDIDFGNLDKVMEGEFRPGHFAGVAQVVKRLLDIVKPDKLFMGQKDFQQFTIIQNMINQLKIKTELVVCPILREESGLAMSSRNVRLSQKGRKKAALISKTLNKAAKQTKKLPPKEVEKWALEQLSSPGFEPEYFTIVDGYNLQPVTDFANSDYVVACTAVWHEGVRLIDNLIFWKK